MLKISPNLYGAMLMCLAVLGYILNDTTIKYFASELPIFQTIFIRGIFVSTLLFFICLRNSTFKKPIMKADIPFVFMRSLCDVFATLFFLTALFNMPLANSNAILQTLPLTVTIFGAIFLRERFGWYRAGAIVFGLVGAILIIKPGTQGFNGYSVFAVAAVFFITLREIITRKVSTKSSTIFIAFITALTITTSAACGLLISGDWVYVSKATLIGLAIASLFILMAYYFSIPAMQYGDISFVAPFRFTLMFWAVVLGFLVFEEIPDKLTLIGIAIIILSGIFTIYRENISKLKSDKA